MRQAHWNREDMASPAPRLAIPTYRPGTANHCPSCTHSHWLIGRLTAECAVCGTALPIAVGAPAAFRYLAHAA